MDTMRVCPNCGKAVATEAPNGICPECLMKAGLSTAAGSATGPDPGFVPPAVEVLAKSFPQLEILEFLGKGGMGAVYKARQPGLDRLVALKILAPRGGVDPGFAERFTREARALARLSHPSIVAVYDFGQADDLHYFIMEYVDGLSLRQLEQAGKFSPREALRIIPQVCEALQFAHDEGIVHRDIKPENVLLDKKGRVKIADFGLARILGREPSTVRLTGAQDVVGTPHYMAPEQVERPREVDHRADIFSLGVVFYEMLTGELPIGRFAPPSRKVEVDVRLDEVVLHALEKEPERRYQHASQIKTDVESISRAPATPPPVVAQAPTADQIRRQVKGPAVGLMVAGIANWVTLPFIILFAFPILSRVASNAKAAGVPEASALRVAALLVAPFVLCAILIVAALKMMRLENYRSAIGASIVAMLVTPGNLIGFPVGIWSLVVLLRRDVREAFKAREAAGAPSGARRFFAGLTWLWLAGLALLAVGIAGGWSLNRSVARAGTPERMRVLRTFGPGDTAISSAVTNVDGAWSVTAPSTQTVRLFEVSDLAVDKTVLTYRARLKSADLQGRAYLEMWCRFPGKGEFFSRGFDSTFDGPNDWARVQTGFLLRTGQRPDLVKLNLVVEGKGTVEIKDIELLAVEAGY